MKIRNAWLLAAATLLLLEAAPITVSAKARMVGSVTGSVRDDLGAPIAGAVVRLVDRAVMTRTLRSLRTDVKGEFFVANIQPGNYRLRAEAKGFISDIQAVDVRPDVVLSTKFELRRTGRWLDSRADRDDYKWAVRSVPAPILRVQEETPSKSDLASERPEPSFDDRVHGLVQFVGGGSGSAVPGTSEIYTGVNFALARQVHRNLELLLAGQWSADATAPQRLDLVASAAPADQHKLTFVFSLGQFTGFNQTATALRERQSTLRLSDAWQIAGPVIILYGVDVTRFSGAANEIFASPRVGVRWTPTDRTSFDVDYQPAGDETPSSAYQSENARVEFAEPRSFRSLSSGTRLRPNQRLQLGFERLLTDNSSIQAAVFFDDVSGKAVGLVAVPGRASAAFNASFQEMIQQGQTRGARVVYNARLNRFLSGLVGYAFGQGQELAARGLAMPSRILGTDRFHVVSFKLGGELHRTHTHYAGYYRCASRSAVFAVDPFYGRLQVLDPGLSIVISQELPNLGFLPGRWEASLDGRNLLDQRGSFYGNEGWSLISGLGRSVRGAVSVRF